LFNEVHPDTTSSEEKLRLCRPERLNETNPWGRKVAKIGSRKPRTPLCTDVGKGTVQTVTPLPPGLGALKITTARFFRPGGRSTQNDGVSSDVVIPSLLATDDLGERHQPFALSGERISPLFGSYANAIGPSDLSSQVPATALAELVRSSSARIANDAIFTEVREKLEEARTDNGIVRLADILKEREEAESAETNGSEKGSEAGADAAAVDVADTDPLDPQMKEALEVLADLVSLTQRATANAPPPDPERET
jgi:carboxyl-terminal processing protease